MKKIVFSSICLLLLITSCKKDLSFDANSNTSARTLTQQDFDWETADTMPHVSGGPTVLVPWASGVNKEFPDAFLTDWKKSDGWVLVYNTFNTVQNLDNRYFILYNRYRGLLRGYFWSSPSTPVASRKVEHDLSFAGMPTNSPLLFGASDVVDMSAPATINTLVQPYQTPSSGAWFAAEYEINYIPNIASLDASNNRLQWDVNGINITDINLNGSSTATTTGTLSSKTPPSSSNFFSNVIKGGITAVSNTGIADATKALKDTSASEGSSVLHVFDSFLTGILSSGITGVAGKVISLLSGLVSGSSSAKTSVSYANFQSQANYTFTGSLESNSSLSNPSFVLPGSSGASTTSGYAPLYNQPLGVFTLSGNPTIDIISEQYVDYTFDPSPSDPDDRILEDEEYNNVQEIKLDTSSFSIIFNPNIINSSADGARIENLKEEFLTNNFLADTSISAFERQEVINDSTTLKVYSPASAVLNLFPTDVLDGDPVFGKLHAVAYFNDVNGLNNFNFTNAIYYLRISFNVVPNNGTSPTVAIFHTFKINAPTYTVNPGQ